MTGPTIQIRRAAVSDVKAITEIYNEAIRTTTATFDLESKTVEDRLVWFAAHDDRHPVLVADVNGQVAGWGCLNEWSDRPAYANTAETSFYVQQAFRGQGIGKALKLRLIETARELGMHTLLARMAEGNAASIHLNEICGFRHIGTMRDVGLKFGQLLDVHIMQLMLDDVSNSTAPPAGSPQLQQPDGSERIEAVDELSESQIVQLHALYQREWWCQSRSLADVRNMLANSSLVLGLVETQTGRLAGFCRVLTDFTFRGTLYDVIVEESFRGRGLGKRLMDLLAGHPKLQRVSCLWLCCEPKMVPFYQSWGFEVFAEGPLWMIKPQREG
jgi:L-amino acid N-acyltransferase